MCERFITADQAVQLKVIFIMHFILTALSSVGFWASGGYVFYNLIFIILILLEIREHTGFFLPLAVLINVNCAFIDILLLVTEFPDNDNAREQFSATMSILQLILARPFSSIVMIRIALQNADFSILTRENINAMFFEWNTPAPTAHNEITTVPT